jgi:hypothetical protein
MIRYTEHDRIEFLKAAISAFKDVRTTWKLEDEVDLLAEAALKMSADFDSVNTTMKEFVRDHGSDFPELKEYQQQWEGYKEASLSFQCIRLQGLVLKITRDGRVCFGPLAILRPMRVPVIGVRLQLTTT